MLIRRALTMLAFAATISGCGGSNDLTDPHVIASDLRGTWSQPPGVPGSRFEFTLSVSDTTIAGPGIFAIEAGASGTSAVTGGIVGSQVALAFVNSIGIKQHSSGTLTAPDELSGAFWQESTVGGSAPIVI